MDTLMDAGQPECPLPEARWNHLRQAGIQWIFRGGSAEFSSFSCITLENHTDTFFSQRSTSTHLHIFSA